MGRQKSSERIYLETLLSDTTDGIWHDREEVFFAWAEKINPAKAQRAATKAYGGDSEARAKKVSDQQLEMFGARHIFNQLLGSLRSTNRIEERKTDKGVIIRFLSEEDTADLDSYNSLIILDETTTDRIISMHDPRQNVLVVSLKRLEDWSDTDLNLLVSWCQVREDESDTYNFAKLLALKVLHNRSAVFKANRA